MPSDEWLLAPPDQWETYDGSPSHWDNQVLIRLVWYAGGDWQEDFFVCECGVHLDNVMMDWVDQYFDDDDEGEVSWDDWKWEYVQDGVEIDEWDTPNSLGMEEYATIMRVG
ncbi:hypothetical protein IAT38_005346 [Cryptococcus sp. DSM 104549]